MLLQCSNVQLKTLGSSSALHLKLLEMQPKFSSPHTIENKYDTLGHRQLSIQIIRTAMSDHNLSLVQGILVVLIRDTRTNLHRVACRPIRLITIYNGKKGTVDSHEQASPSSSYLDFHPIAHPYPRHIRPHQAASHPPAQTRCQKRHCTDFC